MASRQAAPRIDHQLKEEEEAPCREEGEDCVSRRSRWTQNQKSDGYLDEAMDSKTQEDDHSKDLNADGRTGVSYHDWSFC